MKTSEKTTGTKVANAKSENSAKNFFKDLDKSLFVTEKNAKADIYKVEAYRDIMGLKDGEELTNEIKRAARRKLRKLKENFASSIIFANQKDPAKAKALIEQFKEFYATYFVLSDYSLQSLCSANTKPDNKDLMQRFLEVVNKCK